MFRRTVDGVVADIQRKVDQLADISKDQLAEADHFQSEASAAMQRENAARHEASRADRLRAKFQALIS